MDAKSYSIHASLLVRAFQQNAQHKDISKPRDTHTKTRRQVKDAWHSKNAFEENATASEGRFSRIAEIVTDTESSQNPFFHTLQKPHLIRNTGIKLAVLLSRFS